MFLHHHTLFFFTTSLGRSEVAHVTVKIHNWFGRLKCYCWWVIVSHETPVSRSNSKVNERRKKVCKMSQIIQNTHHSPTRRRSELSSCSTVAVLDARSWSFDCAKSPDVPCRRSMTSLNSNFYPIISCDTLKKLWTLLRRKIFSSPNFPPIDPVTNWAE